MFRMQDELLGKHPEVLSRSWSDERMLQQNGWAIEKDCRRGSASDKARQA